MKERADAATDLFTLALPTLEFVGVYPANPALLGWSDTSPAHSRSLGLVDFI